MGTISLKIGTLERMHLAEAVCDGALDRNMGALGHVSRRWRDSVCCGQGIGERVRVCVCEQRLWARRENNPSALRGARHGGLVARAGLAKAGAGGARQ